MGHSGPCFLWPSGLFLSSGRFKTQFSSKKTTSLGEKLLHFEGNAFWKCVRKHLKVQNVSCQPPYFVFSEYPSSLCSHSSLTAPPERLNAPSVYACHFYELPDSCQSGVSFSGEPSLNRWCLRVQEEVNKKLTFCSVTPVEARCDQAVASVTTCLLYASSQGKKAHAGHVICV